MNANDIVLGQKEAFEDNFSSPERSGTHTTKEPLTRFLRDRRLRLAVRYLTKYLSVDIDKIKDWKILIICGGVGGEGIFFSNMGFRNTTNSDFSENALKVCSTLAPHIKTLQLNAESLELPDKSFDLVVVQDGLHHLSRPVLGFTEMLRVAKKAVVVIEPHSGFIAKLLGREWEKCGNTYNFVFRWNKKILEQATKSYLLKNVNHIKDLRIWDHSTAMLKIINFFPGTLQLKLAKLIYALLNTFFGRFGNNMVGIVIKNNPMSSS